jgi:hypothetical protein
MIDRVPTFIRMEPIDIVLEAVESGCRYHKEVVAYCNANGYKCTSAQPLLIALRNRGKIYSFVQYEHSQPINLWYSGEKPTAIQPHDLPPLVAQWGGYGAIEPPIQKEYVSCDDYHTQSALTNKLTANPGTSWPMMETAL